MNVVVHLRTPGTNHVGQKANRIREVALVVKLNSGFLNRGRRMYPLLQDLPFALAMAPLGAFLPRAQSGTTQSNVSRAQVIR